MSTVAAGREAIRASTTAKLRMLNDERLARDTAEVGASPQVGIDLGDLLTNLVTWVRRFVVVSDTQAVAIVLWVAHSHAFEAADCTPYLQITSATAEAGKTRLLEVLDLVVAEPWLTGRTSAAALVRKVDANSPTLLLDESDAAFNGEKEYAEALRGILNTGYRRSGKSTLCIRQGANFTFRDFSTFCPKAIAGIGKLPDTIVSRAIRIELRRRTKAEPVAKFRERDARIEAEPIRRGSSRGRTTARSRHSRRRVPPCRPRCAIVPRTSSNHSSLSRTWPAASGPSGRGRPLSR